MAKKAKDPGYLHALRVLRANLESFEHFASSAEAAELECAFQKTISWCSGLSSHFANNPARVFLGGLWSEVVNILALVPLCFYRQSLIIMRIMLDHALAFSFYESHSKEFRTASQKQDFWMSRERIHEFHKLHSWDPRLQIESLGVWSNFNALYSDLSRFIHAQGPKKMSLVSCVDDIKPDAEDLKRVCCMAQRTDHVIGMFFASLYQDAFKEFTPDLQRTILKGWNAEITCGLRLSP